MMQVLDITSNKNRLIIYGVGGQSQIYNNFYPYLYVHPKQNKLYDVLDKIHMHMDVISHTVCLRYLPLGYQEQKQQMIKVKTDDPKNIRNLREELKSEDVLNIYEADILYKNRFMIDMDIGGMSWIDEKCHRTNNSINAEMKILSIDFEMLPPTDGRMPESSKDQIIVASLAFSPQYEGKDTLVLVASPNVPLESDVIGFNNERDLLSYLNILLDDYNPDIITGYNINEFDFPYLVGRYANNRLNNTWGRNQGQIYIKQLIDRKNISITGRVVLDLLPLIRKNYSYQNYTLRTVSHELLKWEKLDLNMQDMRTFWIANNQNSLKEICDYARRDAHLVLKLLEKTKLLDRFVAISAKTGLLLQDCIDGGQTGKIDMLIMREFKKIDRVMGSKPEIEEDESDEVKYEGAVILEPVRGYLKDVVVCDYRSLYPTIMISQNYSPDSIILSEEYLKHPHHKAVVGGTFINKDIYEGVVPKILSELLNGRMVIKKEMKAYAKDSDEYSFLDAQQYAIKILLNSFYGYTGYTRSRLYLLDIAEAVTSFGRQNILATKDMIDNFGKLVKMGDKIYKRDEVKNINFDNDKIRYFNTRVVYGDSITNDRFIPIRKDNLINVINIERIFDISVKLDGDDKKEYGVLPGYETVTRNGWQPIKTIMRHKTNKKIYRVNQKYGESITTEDHSYITEKGETSPIDMKDNHMINIKIPDNERTLTDIDLMDYLKDYCFDGRHFIAEKEYICISGNKKAQNIKIKRYLNEEDINTLCILLAGYITNGSSTFGNKIGASICDSNIDWLVKMQNCYNDLIIGAKTSIIESNKKIRCIEGYKPYKDNTCKLQMGNMPTAHLFNALCGHGAKNKHMPSFIYNLSKDIQEIFLDSLIDGDGTRKFDKKYSEEYCENNFWYSTISLELISNLSVLLNLLKINHTINYRYEKGEYAIKTITNHHDKKLVCKIQEEEYNGYVYDLSVENNHEFVDACGCILLHNTDSLFIENKETFGRYGDIDLDTIKMIGEFIAEMATARLPEPMALLYEKIAKRIIFEQKKKYCYLRYDKGKDGWKSEIATMGMETKRRDSCPIVADCLKKCIELVLQDDNLTGAVEHASKTITEIMRKNKFNSLDEIKDLIITRKFTKASNLYKVIPVHIKVAKKIFDRGIALNLGDRIQYLIYKGSAKNPLDRADTPEYILENNIELDTKYYIEKQLFPPLKRFFNCFGINDVDLWRDAPRTKKVHNRIHKTENNHKQLSLFNY